jgi:membrane protein implicated in regulation of membrane protease activity
MTREFLRRFLWHAAHATAILSLVLLIGEILVPGSVLPYIHLPALIVFSFILMMLVYV